MAREHKISVRHGEAEYDHLGPRRERETKQNILLSRLAEVTLRAVELRLQQGHLPHEGLTHSLCILALVQVDLGGGHADVGLLKVLLGALEAGLERQHLVVAEGKLLGQLLDLCIRSVGARHGCVDLDAQGIQFLGSRRKLIDSVLYCR